MGRSYAEIQAEIGRLQKEAQAVRAAETAAVISEIRDKMAAYGLSIDDFAGRWQPSSAIRRPAKPGADADARRAGWLKQNRKARRARSLRRASKCPTRRAQGAARASPH